MGVWWMVSMLACGGSPAETPSATPAAEASPEAPAPPAARGERSDIDIEGLAAALETGAPIIDVRTPAEFAEGHVPGAVNLPLGDWTPDDEALQAYARDEPLYVICRSGGRSSRAADQLAAGGFRVVNVEGGTLGWTGSGRSVDK